MNIVKLLIQALIAAFITMILIYVIKKFTAGKNIPVVSMVAEGV